jgi:hypothetical protein
MNTLETFGNVNDYEVRIIKDYTESFVNYITDLSFDYANGGHEQSINYTRERFMVAFFNDKRFTHGYCLVEHKGNPILSFGLDDFYGWAVISRYLRYADRQEDTSLFVPIGYGVAFPHVISNVKGIKGLCSTQNVNTRDLMGMIFKRYKRHIGSGDLFGKAAEMITKTRKLPYSVTYRHTIQDVFVYDNENDPPFEKYDRS